MTYRVRIYLQRAGQSAGGYIGEKDLLKPPARDARVTFEHEGRMVSGRIERIVPDNWIAGSELIPTLHVVQNA
jgi:hypothetical protein